MRQVAFNCRTITPMFLADADNRTPELRPPSIKGAMRFWWRAVQRFASPDDLKKKEAELFGSSGESFGRAPFNIRAQGVKLNIGKDQPLPHHRNDWCGEDKGCRNNNRGVCDKQVPLPCYKKGGTFQVRFESRDDSASFAGKVFRLSSIVGGLGRRCRRGFGSYCIQEDTGDNTLLIKEITSLLNYLHGGNGYTIVNNHNIHGRPPCDVIVSPTTITDYPQIRYVAVKRTTQKPDYILIKIGEASHKKPGDDCGFVHGPNRLASPVYFSLYKYNTDLFLISTLLSSNMDQAYQEQLIDEVISNV